MNNELQVFNFDDNKVRTITIDDEPYFVGKDVANALGYKNTKDALVKHVDPEDKLGSRIATSGQNREMTVINESGVYSLIFSSKLDSAKQFKRWVTKEVLPTLRKIGSYQVPNNFFLIEDADSIKKAQEAKNNRNNALARNAITKQSQLIYNYALRVDDSVYQQRLLKVGSQLLLDHLYIEI